MLCLLFVSLLSKHCFLTFVCCFYANAAVAAHTQLIRTSYLFKFHDFFALSLSSPKKCKVTLVVPNEFVAILKSTCAKLIGAGFLKREFVNAEFWSSLPAKFRSRREKKSVQKRPSSSQEETRTNAKKKASSMPDKPPIVKPKSGSKEFNIQLFKKLINQNGITYEILRKKG